MQMDTANKPIKILLEMRAALDGHAGIPHQTRLLFRGLSLLHEISVEGLIQSSTNSLGKGLPRGDRTWLGPLSADRQINRLSRVVIMLEQKFRRSNLSVVPVALRYLLGGSEELTGSRHAIFATSSGGACLPERYRPVISIRSRMPRTESRGRRGPPCTSAR